MNCTGKDDVNRIIKINISEIEKRQDYHLAFWDKFEPVDYKVHFAMGIFISIFGIIAFFGNVCVIIACLSPRWTQHRRSVMLYVMNLAVADTVICVFGFPMMAISSFYGNWIFDKIGCDIYSFGCGIGGIASICTMAVIARERHRAISRDMLPFQMRGYSGIKQPLIVILIIWIFASIMVAPPLFGWSRYVVDGHGTSCTFDYITQTGSNRSFYLFLFICGFVFPLSVTTFYYCRLMWFVRSHDRSLESHCHSLQHFSLRCRQWRRRELRLSRSCVIVVLTFVLAWTPYAVVTLVAAFGHQDHMTPLTSLIPGLVAKMCVIHNPIIYSMSDSRFKTALMSMLKLRLNQHS